MTITDNPTAWQPSDTMPAITLLIEEPPSREVALRPGPLGLALIDNTPAQVTLVNQDKDPADVTQYRLVNPWQWPCLIGGVLTIGVVIAAFATAVVAEDHIERATSTILASLVLFLALRGMHYRYDRRVQSADAFKPITKP
ncbi:hypothetical protein AB0B94_30830 [Micromonospora sp. NPDC048986]|uniref:hypothetical protein n=1 Tax=Micromonospora sp. NPDC048986 TaxID=3155644 RepID=UPI0033E3DB84